MSPKPIPRTFLGWAITPFPEAGRGDVGVPLVSMLLPSAGGKGGGDRERANRMFVGLVTLLPITCFFNKDIVLNSSYVTTPFVLQYSIEKCLFLAKPQTAQPQSSKPEVKRQRNTVCSRLFRLDRISTALLRHIGIVY